MSGKILVRQLSNSSLAGRSAEFDSLTVGLGRLPENGVVYDPQIDLLVSGRHCRVIAEEGRLYVEDLKSRNGTFVNGVAVQGRREVTERDRISLGPNGPTFAVSLTDHDGPGTVQGQTPVAASPPPMPGVPMTAGASVAAGGKQGIGVQTLMMELDKVTSRERRRSWRIVGGVLAVIGVLLAASAAVFVFFILPALRQPPAPAAPPAVVMKDDSVDWSRTLAAPRQSLYLVILRIPGDADRPAGTAWSIDKPRGLLATNAHIAELYNTAQRRGGSLIARSVAHPRHDLRIVGMEQHPAYVEWEKLREPFDLRDPNTMESVAMGSPGDVGLLKVNAADAGKMSPPLELASDEEVRALLPGTPLAYVGFPMEGIIDPVDIENPEPQQLPGALSRMTDQFQGAEVPARLEQLAYAMVIRGGASGSPVFNKSGKVVGFVAGMNAFGSIGGTRLEVSGTGFGPRVDYLRELLDGSAKEKNAARTDFFRAMLRKRFENRQSMHAGKFAIAAAKEMFAEATRADRPSSKAGPDAKEVEAKVVKPIKTGEAGAIDVAFKVPRKGLYAIVVTSSDPEMLPLEVRPSGTIRAGETWVFRLEPAKQFAEGKVVEVKIGARPVAATRPVELTVRLLQAAE